MKPASPVSSPSMSGQASSPNGSFTNVAAGCIMREDSRSSVTGAVISTKRAPEPAAGISSSGSSRSTDRRLANLASMVFPSASEKGGSMIGNDEICGARINVGDEGGAGCDDDEERHNRPRTYSYRNNTSLLSSSEAALAAFSAGAPSSQRHILSYSSKFSHPIPRDVGSTTLAYPLSCPGELIVYSWGRGEDGQLGIGDTSDQDVPTYVDSLRGVGVKQIACGSGHTVVLTGEGEVYTWGRGDDGRLGHGDNGWKYVPRLANSLTGQIITHVTCGSYHTAAVSSNGDLFTYVLFLFCFSQDLFLFWLQNNGVCFLFDVVLHL